MEHDIDLQFRGFPIRAEAVSDETLPTVRIYFDDPTDYDEVFLVLNRFLSALSWAERAPVRIVMSAGGGAQVRFGRNGEGVLVARRRGFPALPQPSDHRALLALALYRDALSLNSIPYQFLSFFKIINIVYGTGPEQKRWIAQEIDRLVSQDAVTRLGELPDGRAQQASSLYQSGRCAVAHAFGDPIVDPDNVSDERRLRSDLPVIHELADNLMSAEFGLIR